MAKVKLLCSEVASKLAVKFLFTTKVVEGFEVKGIIPLRGAGRAALSGVGRTHVVRTFFGGHTEHRSVLIRTLQARLRPPSPRTKKSAEKTLCRRRFQAKAYLF